MTVAAIVERDGRFLLVEEETSEGLRLNNPAGHLDPGESPAQACEREALEETTRRFTPTSLLGIYLSRTVKPGGYDVTYLRLAFRGQLGEVVPGAKLDQGILRTVWMTPDEIRATQQVHRSPLVVQCMEDHLRGQSLPLSALYTHASVLE